MSEQKINSGPIRETISAALEQNIRLGATLKQALEEIDREPVKSPPWPSLEILDGPVSGMYIKSRAGFVHDGKVIGLRYKGKTGVTLSGDRYTLDSFEKKGFVGTLTLDDGTQIAFPAWAGGFAQMRSGGLIVCNKLRDYSLQLRSGAVGPDGFIYCPQYSKGGGVIRYDHNQEKIRALNYRRDSSAHYFRGHWGSAAGSGKVFLLPWLDNKIGIIRDKDFVNQLPGEVHGGLANPHKSPKFSHGLTIGDEICCFPRRAETMLIINHVLETFEEIPLDPELLAAFDGKSKSFGSWLGPDGWMYSCMWGIGIQMRFHPASRKMEWRDLRAEIAETGWLRYARPGATSWGNGISTEAYLLGSSAYHLTGDGAPFKMVFPG